MWDFRKVISSCLLYPLPLNPHFFQFNLYVFFDQFVSHNFRKVGRITDQKLYFELLLDIFTQMKHKYKFSVSQTELITTFSFHSSNQFFFLHSHISVSSIYFSTWNLWGILDTSRSLIFQILLPTFFSI